MTRANTLIHTQANIVTVSGRSIRIAAALSILCLGQTQAWAQQILVVDQVVSYGGTGCHDGFKPLEAAPASWTSPVNYVDGNVTVQMEVLSKPSRSPIVINVNLNPGATSAFTVAIPDVRGPGVYERSFSLRSELGRNLKGELYNAFSGALIGGHLSHTTEREGAGAIDPTPIETRIRIWLTPKGTRFSSQWCMVEVPIEEAVRVRNAAVHLLAGRLGMARANASKHADDKNPEKAEIAARIVGAIDSYVSGRVELLERIRAEEPEYALHSMKTLAQGLRGCELADGILDTANSWSKDAAFVNAIKARSMLEGLETAADMLMHKLGGKIASDPVMARRYGSDISLVARRIAAIEKNYSDTPSCKAALIVKTRLGIGIEVERTQVAGSRRRQPAHAQKASRPERKKEVQPPPEGNLIVNGGFERVEERSKMALMWRGRQWGTNGTRFSVYVSRSQPHDGTRCIVVRAEDEGCMPGVSTSLKLTPWLYELRYWACTDLGKTAAVKSHLADRDSDVTMITDEWRQYVHRVRVDETRPLADVRLWTTSADVRVRFDDVEVVAVREKEEQD